MMPRPRLWASPTSNPATRARRSSIEIWQSNPQFVQKITVHGNSGDDFKMSASFQRNYRYFFCRPFCPHCNWGHQPEIRTRGFGFRVFGLLQGPYPEAELHLRWGLMLERPFYAFHLIMWKPREDISFYIWLMPCFNRRNTPFERSIQVKFKKK